MMKLLCVEWIRFRRNPLNIWIISLFFILLTISAIWSGLAAREFRAKASAPAIQQSATNQAEMHDAPKISESASKSTTKSSAYSASSAKEPLRLPALGGLVLNVSQMDLLSPAIKISIRSRHTDGRTSDQLFNPLMHEFGLLDFATVFALLTPLVIIALTYGLVQEDRESGVWRLVCTQTSQPWRLVLTALTLRYGLLLLIGVTASVLAFLLDPASTSIAAGQWLLMLAVYNLVWFSMAGFFMLLQISSGAVAIAMLGTWLVLTFGVPAGISWAADRSSPMPSRMKAIIDIRQFQEQSNQQRESLLTGWYQAHPEVKPTGPLKSLPREINGLPATLQLDSRIRPLMIQFDEARKHQFEFMERWSSLSPALGLILMSDRLAGVDAPRYADFVQAVNQFEDQWRGFFVPLIMASAPWSDDMQNSLPQFVVAKDGDSSASLSLPISQLKIAMILLVLLIGLRSRFAKT
jgi:ABC-2 type transport system permease protein